MTFPYFDCNQSCSPDEKTTFIFLHDFQVLNQMTNISKDEKNMIGFAAEEDEEQIHVEKY